MDFKIDAYPVDDTTNGIRSTQKIKILICYILNATQAEMSSDVIRSVLYDNGIANYFEVSQAIDDLLRVNALDVKEKDGVNQYSVNGNGKKIAKDLGGELSVYIKNKAAKAAALTLIYEKRKRENDVKIVKINDKRYRLDITMYSGLSRDKDGEMLKLSLYVSDDFQANVMKRSFMNNPVRLYSDVINGLTSDAEFKE